MSIKCGHCGGRHESVAEVRSCANVPAASQAIQPTSEYRGSGRPATVKQDKFIEALLQERTEQYADNVPVLRKAIATLRDGGHWTTKAASEMIDALLDNLPVDRSKVERHDALDGHAMPADPAPRPTPAARRQSDILADMPAGYYAIESLTGNNDLDFFCVREHKPSGNHYMRRVVGGHADAERVPMSVVAKAAAAIKEFGVDASRKLYADEIGCCFVCNRTLTDEESRRAGMGPVCRGAH